MRRRPPPIVPARRLSTMQRPAAFTLAVLALGCAEGDAAPTGRDGAPAPATAPFLERAAELGLDFVHFNGMTGRYHMAEVAGPGGALLDWDGDGDLDVLMLQGTLLDPSESMQEALFPPAGEMLPLSARLYSNQLVESGRLSFADVTAEAGLEVTAGRYGMGVAAGDYDGDGDVDLYLTHFGRDQLLENRDGRFTDVTAAAGIEADGWTVATVFFDADRDGDLDLFVGGYIAFDPETAEPCYDLTGALDYCGPRAFPPLPDTLWIHRGDGTFEDRTTERGLTGGFGPALGTVTTDLSGDGLVDLYVANDGRPNNLWVARPDGTFEDSALLAGVAVNAKGKPEASMGVDAGDFDGDGDLDLFMTHLERETNTLYLNEGGGMFTDRSAASGLAAPSLPMTAFGAAFFDYDNDGWLDILAVNGDVTKIPALIHAGDPFPLHQPNQLFRNLGADGGGARFADVSAESGEAFELSEVSRGALFGDLDNDGDTDVVVVNNNGPARLLVNQVGSARPWVGLELVTGDPPRIAHGAQAALTLGGRPVRRGRVRVDGSFASANDPRVLFGLGDGLDYDGVTVTWPDGSEEAFPAPPRGRYTRLVQGGGRGTTARPVEVDS